MPVFECFFIRIDREMDIWLLYWRNKTPDSCMNERQNACFGKILPLQKRLTPDRIQSSAGAAGLRSSR